MTCTVAVTNGVGTQTGKLFAFDAVSTVSLTGLAAAYNGLALTAYVTTQDGKTALAPLATCTAGTTTASFAFDFRTRTCRGLFTAGNQTEQTVRLRVMVTATSQVVCDALLAMVPGPEAGTTTTSTGAAAATLAQAQALVDAHAAGSLHTYPTTGKTTPMDADVLTLWDSAATFARKALTLANLKAFLAYLTQAAADLRYALLAHGHSGTTDGSKLTQANTHQSPDTDATPASIHHTTGTGANQAAAGNDARLADERVPTAAGLAAKLDAAAAETTPADAWKVPVVVTSALKHCTWANVVAALKLVLFGISVGTTLPTTGNSNYRLCVLTAQDATAKAGQGLYWYDGTGWLCIICTTPYAWGNMGATPTMALIPGCDYVFVMDQIVTSWTLTLTRCGVVNWTKTGAFACVDPTCTGRTFGQRSGTGFDKITSAKIEGSFRDDGTNMVCSTVEIAA